ncbi:hypothetical protein E6O75_ATG10735 [Venturia nashicola]|uniref:Uncharacterized protein n=1 Tax=Venturia nashicola TaxID=86259 RepID=A0A4Z1NQZ9_9PEZI|nr:hypothetical protein E6O75_ATG10735 [Venturia nashicola]
MEPRYLGMPAYQQGGVAPGSLGKDYAGLTPLGANIIALIISLVTQLVLVYCLSQRITAIANPREAPFATWLVVTLFVTSFIFAFVAAILRFGISTNKNIQICHASIWLCLTLYFITKILIYWYFVEKAASGVYHKQNFARANMCPVDPMGPYVVLWGLTFAARLYYIDNRHICYLGIGRPILIPLIIWDLLLNIYSTALFISPLRKLYSYQTNSNPGLRKMARRTFTGCVISLLCTIMNLMVQSILDGEPAWLCLMLFLLNVLVIHWVAHTDIERNQKKNRQSDKMQLASRIPSRRIWFNRNSKDLGSSCDDHARSSVPSCRVDRHASMSFESSESPWDGLTGVNTMIEAGDGSCGGSFIMEPMSIKVKTSHKREENLAESPAVGQVKVPMKAFKINRSRTTAWTQKTQRNGKDAAVRNDGV